MLKKIFKTLLTAVMLLTFLCPIATVNASTEPAMSIVKIANTDGEYKVVLTAGVYGLSIGDEVTLGISLNGSPETPFVFYVDTYVEPYAAYEVTTVDYTAFAGAAVWIDVYLNNVQVTEYSLKYYITGVTIDGNGYVVTAYDWSLCPPERLPKPNAPQNSSRGNSAQPFGMNNQPDLLSQIIEPSGLLPYSDEWIDNEFTLDTSDTESVEITRENALSDEELIFTELELEEDDPNGSGGGFFPASVEPNFQTTYATIIAPAVANGLNQPKSGNYGSEDINPYSGEMTLRFNDISLPGRNGLDLNVGRIYQTAQAELGENMVTYQPDKNGNLGLRFAWDYSSYLNDRYNLGTGWSFNFPSVQIAHEYNKEPVDYIIPSEDEGQPPTHGTTYYYLETYELYYHTGNGEVYQVEFGNDPNGSNLKDYYKKDIRFNKNDAGYSNGQATSYYSMTLADKTKQYFAQDGRFLGVVDRFGNEIKFEHEMRTIVNRVPNGNFEHGLSMWVASAERDINVTTNKGKDDNNCLEFYSRTYNNEIIIQSNPVLVEPMKPYVVKASFFSQSGTDTAKIRILRFDEALGFRSHLTFNTGTISAGEWITKEFEFTTTSATRFIAVQIEAPFGTRGLFVDNAEVDSKKPLISKITDTIGREITFNYGPGYTGAGIADTITIQVKNPAKTETKTLSYNKKNYDITMFGPNDVRDTRHVWYLWDCNTDGTPDGQVSYTYEGDIINGQRSLLYLHPKAKTPQGDEYHPKPILNKINYKSTETRYTYEKVRKHLGEQGYYDTLRVTSRYEIKEYFNTDNPTETPKIGAEENKITYSYGGTYNGQSFNNETGYPNFTFTNKTTLGELYNCTEKNWYSLTDQTKNPTTVTTFSNAKLKKDVTENIQNEYTYDTTFKDNISEVKTTISGNITYVCTGYNSWGGVETQTKPITDTIKNNPAQKEKYTTTYGYNATYKKPETVSYYNDADGVLLVNETVYDNLGRVTDTINENGDKTGYFYEDLTYPGNITKSISYDIAGLQGTVTANKINTYTYDNYNAYVATTTQNGSRTYQYQYEYIWGKLKKEILPNVGAFDYFYDGVGRLTEKRNPPILNDGYLFKIITTYTYPVVRRIYDGKYYNFQNITKELHTLQNGASSAVKYLTEEAYYDLTGNLWEARSITPDTPAFQIPTYYTYDSGSRLMQIKDYKNDTTSYAYDKLSRPTLITDAKGGKYWTDYDDTNRTRLTYFTPYNSNVQENHIKEFYDIFGYVSEIKAYPQGYTSPPPNSILTQSYEFNIAGLLTKFTDPKSNETQYKYDKLERLSATILPDGTYAEARYNSANTPIFEKQFDGSGEAVSGRVSLLDENGDVNTQFLTNGMQIQKGNSYQTNDMGLPSFVKEGENEFSFNYDPSNNLVEKTNGAYSTQYRYNQHGLTIASANTADITNINYSYNTLGRLHQKQQSGFNPSTYTYKNFGGIDTFTNPFNRSETWNYDQNNRLTTITSESKTYTYDYYGDGMVKSILYPNGVKSEYWYDNLNRVERLKITKTNGTVTLNDFTYTYDDNSNMATEKDNNVLKKSFTYDSLNRLKTANYGDSNTITYFYDALNNREREETRNGSNVLISTKEYFYNKQSQLVEVKVDNVTTDTYTYNNTGAVLTHNSEVFAYDMWDRLISFTNSSNVTTEYKYDVNGLRTSKGNTQYIVDANNNVIAETDHNGTATAQTIWGIKPLSRKVDNNYYYYIYNAHGDVIGLVNESGTVINNYSYDAWGNILSQSETVPQPIKYAGEYQDENGLIYLRARYFDPKVGRFISLDKIEGNIRKPLSMNRYSYCQNNPISFIDPTGLAYEESDITAYYAGIITYAQYEEISTQTQAYKDAAKNNDYDAMNRARSIAVAIRRVHNANYDDTFDYTHGGKYPQGGVYNAEVPPPSTGYKAPKKGPVWDKEKKGWKDKDDNVWVKDKAHNDDHWDVEYPNGGYDNVYRDGSVRSGSGGRGKYSPVEQYVDANDVVAAAGITIGAVVLYQGVKWTVAVITAGPSGGISLGIAACTP